MALIITSATFIATPAMASTHTYGGLLPDAYYSGLSLCETGSNWNHSTKSYTGGLGIHRKTWRTWSNYPSAKGRTPAEQVKVADAIAFTSHINPDGRKIWRVGPWGWGCLRKSVKLQAYICNSKHRLVIRWQRKCK